MQEEIFADGIGSIVFEGGVMRIDLISRVPGNRDKDSKPQMAFRQRIIMPVEGFLDSYKIIREILEKMEQSGLITNRPPQNNEAQTSAENSQSPVQQAD
ncbi:MAG: hypothetical protein ABFD50_22950 [Smithella sp.]